MRIIPEDIRDDVIEVTKNIIDVKMKIRGADFLKA